MSDWKGIPSGHGEEVDQLAEAAQVFWSDNAWAISQTLWTDGDTNAYAYKRKGRNESGHMEEERLYVVEGEIRGERRIFEEREIKTIDLGTVTE